MTDAETSLASITASLPQELAQSLEELDADYLARLLILQKAIEQRAHMISVEIARVMTKMELPVPLLPRED